MRGIFDDVSAGAMRLMDNVDALFQSFFGGSIMDTVTATFAGLLGVAQKLGQYWMGTLSIAWNLIMELANLSVQALTAASDTFNELWGTVSEGNTVFDSLSAGWSSFQGMIEAGVGSVGSFFTGLIDDLKFFSRNFGTVWDIAVELTSIGIQNAFERIKTFGTNVIEVGTWLVTNWRTIFNDMFTAATTILSNIGTNLSDFYSAVKSWMAGDGFNFEVTGLLDGFEGTTELPELTQPVTIDTTNRLEQLYEDIGRDEMNHLAEQKKRDEQRAADQAAAAEKQKQQAEDTAEAVAAVETKTGNETTKTVQNNERKKRKAAEDTKAAQIGGAEQVFSRTATALAKAAAAKLPTKKPPKAAPDVASPAAASKVAPAARDFKAKAGLPAGIEVKGTQKLETELNQSARGTNELRSSIDQLNQTMKSKSTTARLA